MRKTDSWRIGNTNRFKTPPKCQSCGATATKRVRFEDLYSKLIVVLCDECAGKEYLELLLQGRFSWPVKGDEAV